MSTVTTIPSPVILPQQAIAVLVVEVAAVLVVVVVEGAAIGRSAVGDTAPCSGGSGEGGGCETGDQRTCPGSRGGGGGGGGERGGQGSGPGRHHRPNERGWAGPCALDVNSADP